MNESVKADLLYALSQAPGLLKAGDATALKELSDHTIHNASIFQDQDSLSLAVVMYSLSKVIERAKDFNAAHAASLLKEASYHLARSDIGSYRKYIRTLLKLVSEQDSRLQLFIGEVVEQAHIKKGTKVYDHGISAAQAAELLGISQWELMSYIGKTSISDALPTDVQKRLENARKLFK